MLYIGKRDARSGLTLEEILVDEEDGLPVAYPLIPEDRMVVGGVTYHGLGELLAGCQCLREMQAVYDWYVKGGDELRWYSADRQQCLEANLAPSA